MSQDRYFSRYNRLPQNYATTGQEPTRERLYDWAPSPSNPRVDSDDDLERSSTANANVDIAARRDLQRLERALQDYRSARSAISTRSNDYGPVPTASNLRAYFQEDPTESESTSRPWLPPVGFSSHYRQDRHRQHAYYSQLRADRERRHRTTVRNEPKPSEAIARVRNLIRYLSQLRHTGVQGGLDLARELDLDSLYESEEANIPSDLPMHINSLPIPQYTSWLQPGMVWNGLQSTDREPVRTVSMIVSSARRERQRDLLRRTLARRREMGLGGTLDDADQLASDNLLDSERWLSDLRQSTNGRWAFGSSPNPSNSVSSPQPTQSTSDHAGSDHWPVDVTIHSVDYENMTLTGTMSASHIPDKTSTLSQVISDRHRANTSMSSFFTGEIIDFRRQPLETEPEGRTYSVGGLDIDARYWARLGPFKEEIQRVKNLRGRDRTEYLQDSRLWNAFRKAAGAEGDNKDAIPEFPTTATSTTSERQDLSADSQQTPDGDLDTNKETEDEEIMARSLGSAKWIEEKLGKEWILMRWKERCFVTPASQPSSNGQHTSNSENTRTILTTTSSPATSSGSTNPNPSTSWGLTISGFYYIALNRMSGEIDGLYYDPGSQPYQALRMVPEGTSMRGLIGAADTKSNDGSSKCNQGNGITCGCGEQQCRDRVGSRKWFPSLEFR